MLYQFSSVQLVSCVRLFVTPWTAARQASLSITNSRSLLKLLSIESVMPKYWSFTFSISPFNEYSGLISFRMDSLDLLTVRGLLKSLLQHHSSKASVLQHSAFFIVQLSHPYMTTGKTTALTRWTFHYGMKSIACPISKTKDVTAIEPSHCSPFAGEPRGNSGWRQRMPTIWQSTATATPKGAP